MFVICFFGFFFFFLILAKKEERTFLPELVWVFFDDPRYLFF